VEGRDSYVLFADEKNRMLCHYGKRSLGHEQRTKGLKTEKKGPGSAEEA
jgi:hypothetical protein